MKVLSTFIAVLSLISFSHISHADTFTYDEFEGNVINPDRGFFYQIGSKHKPVTAFDLKSSFIDRYIDDEASLFSIKYQVSVNKVYISLNDAFNGPISDKKLADIEGLFTGAKQKGITLIPRFYYIWGRERPQTPKQSIMLGHIDQLAPIINKHKDQISFLEAGFIGAWGEWHSDQYGSKRKPKPFRKDIVKHMLKVFDQDIHIALRYPADHKRLKGTDGYHRLGLHHDCPQYKSDTYPKNNAHQLTINTPQGGEVCKNDPKGQFGASKDKDKYYGCKIMTAYFKKHQFDSLNASDWSGSNSRFLNQNCLSEIRNKLGYRYVMRSSHFKNGTLKLKIENTGWGKSFKSRPVSIKIGDQIIETSHDAADWKAGQSYEIEVSIGQTTKKEAELIIEGGVLLANKTQNKINL